MAQTIKKVLVSDKLAKEGVEVLEKQAGIEVTVKTGMTEDELCDFIKGYHALIIRSATKVTKKVIEAADTLQVVARAGVGVDNVDILEASKKGIVVMNAPGGNTVSTAEHAIAMITSLARHIPQASQSMKEGRWEKKLYMGTELTGKTIGVIGLGRIGKEVAKRALGLQMKVLGYDPYIPGDKLTHLDLDVVPVDQILRESDFITIHTPMNDQTRDIINENNLHTLRNGVKLINCARGGLFNEQALLKGLESGQISGVALDVFSSEPPKDIAVIGHPNCICTPHLGASTDEAQVSVALETAEEIVDFLKNGVARNSLNFPTIDPGDMKFLEPWFFLSEKMGCVLARFGQNQLPKSVDMNFYGNFEDRSLEPLKTGFLKGFLSPIINDTTNYVNAPMFAKDHGLRVNIDQEAADARSDYTHRLKIETLINGEKLVLEGSIINGVGHIIAIQELPIEIRLEGVILLVENKDIPNMVGTIGTFIGGKNINIARLELARREKGSTAYTAISLDTALKTEDISELKNKEGILNIYQFNLSNV